MRNSKLKNRIFNNTAGFSHCKKSMLQLNLNYKGWHAAIKNLDTKNK